MSKRKRHQQQGHYRRPKIRIYYHPENALTRENVIYKLRDLNEVLR